MPRSESPSDRDRKRHRSRSRSRSHDSRSRKDRSRRSRSRDRSRDRERHHKHKHHRRDRSDSRERHRKRSRSRSRSRDDRRRGEGERDGRRDDADRRERVEPARTAPPPPALAAPAYAAAAKPAGEYKDDIADRAARIFGYTAENNPFGDPNLTQTFVWKKREEKETAGKGKGSGVSGGAGAGAGADMSSKEEAERRREALLDEVERAKERRARREAEKEEMDRLRAEESRIKDAAQYREWEARDDEFHLHQARQKALIRLRERRGSPLDMLMFNFVLADTATAMAGQGGDPARLLRDTFLRCATSKADPIDVLQACDAAQLERLLSDIKNMQELENAAASAAGVDAHSSYGTGSGGGAGAGAGGVGQGYGSGSGQDAGAGGVAARRLVGGHGTVPPMSTFSDLWSLATVVVGDELRRAKTREQGLASGQSLASLRAVEDEVDAMFEGKTEADLDGMEGDINGLLSGAGGGAGSVSVGLARGSAVDHDYWHGVLVHLRVARSRAALRRTHETQMLERLSQVDRLTKAWEEGEGGDRARAQARVQSASEVGGGAAGAGARGAGAAGAAAAAAAAAAHTMFADSGRSLGTIAAGDAAGAEERRRLIEARVSALQQQGAWLDGDEAAANAGARAGAGGGSKEADALLSVLDEEGRGLPTGEAEEDAVEEIRLAPVPDGGGVRLPQHLSAAEAALLADKYKPRKPRYFNRVKTGYDWNQYNKTHYDKDNPPPKTVQGYKFTLFYPDLLDRTRTPSFALSPADSPEYVLIRFHAGPPYEDVAFKIVNREWEYSRKHGFKSVFDKGVLQLHFNFKRYRYRK